jgi:uncharacterized cupin superfamily protein
MDVVNIFSAENAEGRIDASAALGSSALAMYVYDLAPGQSSCPYHYEYEEEWLLVVDVASSCAPPTVSTRSRGDLARFAAGPTGAHKIMNRSDAAARTLVFSSARVPAVSVYPDSDKIGVWAGDEANDLVFRRETAVPWSQGEEGWDRA